MSESSTTERLYVGGPMDGERIPTRKSEVAVRVCDDLSATGSRFRTSHYRERTIQTDTGPERVMVFDEASKHDLDRALAKMGECDE